MLYYLAGLTCTEETFAIKAGAQRLAAELGELTGSVEDSYVTFLASIFRSVRFGASDAHGRANLARFNFFKDLGAFSREHPQVKIDLEEHLSTEELKRLAREQETPGRSSMKRDELVATVAPKSS